jgi:antitoxin CcdA
LTRIIGARNLRALNSPGAKHECTHPKKAANLTVRADLLEEARARKINLSQTLEVALAAELKRQREAEWLEQNKEAIEAYNRESPSTACSAIAIVSSADEPVRRLCQSGPDNQGADSLCCSAAIRPAGLHREPCRRAAAAEGGQIDHSGRAPQSGDGHRRQGVLLRVQDIATVPRRMLKKPVTNLSSQRDEILAALDLLFTGL